MKKYILVCLLVSLATFAVSQEIVQWRGPLRDGIYPEKGLMKKWPEGGPALILKIEGIGKGYSQPVVYKNKIYVAGLKDGKDYLSCYTAEGKPVWSKAYAESWPNTYPEIRCTPTIQNDKIYLVGGMGAVVCLDSEKGNILWSKEAHRDFKGEYNRWGIAESVLLTDKAAVYVTGGEETSVVAFNKNNGELLWKSKSLGGARAYASSSLIDWKGKKMILAQTAKHIIGLDPANGDIMWSYDIGQYHLGDSGKGANTLTPVFYKGEIFTTSGYDHPATLLKLADDCKSASLKWKSEMMDTHHGAVILINGNLYGTNWENNSKGKWVSLNWETGKTNWEKDWFTKGSVVSAEGLLYCYEERSGNIALVEPNAEDFKIISTFKVKEGDGPHWTHPAIYNQKLYVRHGNVLLVYDIKA